MEKLGLEAQKEGMNESLEILKSYGILKENEGKFEFIVNIKFIQEILNSHEIYRDFI